MEKIFEWFKHNKIDITPKNKNLYLESITHKSFVHEDKGDSTHYERLEFLGDSILGQITTEYIYNKFYDSDEGKMTLLRSKIVNKSSLAKISKDIGLLEIIRTGNGEKKIGVSESLLEDIMESIIAAVYIDKGYNFVKSFINDNVFKDFDYNLDENSDNLKDYKTRVQELFQAERGKSLIYEAEKKNNNIWISRAYFEDKELGSGEGKSKKEAEQIAAKEVYERMVK